MVTNKEIETVERLLKELGLENSSEEDKQKMLAMLRERFERVTILTLTALLDDEQKRVLSDALSHPDTAEEEVALLAAEVPGFDQALEQALAREYEDIKLSMV